MAEGTATQPPGDLLKIMILEKRNHVLQAIEQYNKFQYSNAYYPDNVIRARMISYFYIIRSSLKRHYEKKNPEWINEAYQIISDKKKPISDLINIFYEIEDFLDLKKLTRFDTMNVWDSTSIEDENEEKSL